LEVLLTTTDCQNRKENATKQLVIDSADNDYAEDFPVEPEAEPLTPEDIARAADAMNFALAAFGVPDKFRAFIDALVGASGGSMDWFDSADIEVGQRARQVTTICLKEKSIEKWTQRFREEFIEWQKARTITLVEAMPGGWENGNRHKSRWRVAGALQIAIDTDRGARLSPKFARSQKAAMRKAAAVVYLEYQAKIQQPAKRQRFKKPRRTCDTFRKLITTYLDDLCGQAFIEHRDLAQMLEDIEVDVYERRVKCSGSAQFPNRVQVQQAQAVSAESMVDKLSTIKTAPEEGRGGYVHTSQKQEYGQGQGHEPAKPREPIGQTVEEFISENPDYWPDSLPESRPDPVAVLQKDQVETRRAKSPSDPQRELILRAGRLVPRTRGEASDLIKELIESGALTDFLSLAELETFDPKAGGRNRKERRFCCPECGTGKPMDDDHRSLSVNTSTGAYTCHRCETAGVVREHLNNSAGATRTFIHTGPTKAEEKSEKWKEWVRDARPIGGTAGADYLEGRGVPSDVAEDAGVKFGQWWKRGDNGAVRFPAVIFPAYDLGGNLVAAQARGIADKTKRTGGDKLEGVFLSTPDALNGDRIAICEAPIDALILQAAGFPALALLGTVWPAWLVDALAGKDVALAQDADEAGDKSAVDLGALLIDRAAAYRLRPQGAKDWAELAEREGLDAVDQCVMEAMERGQEVTR
jgi:hypothetical protein